MIEARELKGKSIVEYLERSGYKPKRTSGKWVFFYSPFRKEANPSLAVNRARNTWSDFGGEERGDLIDLVMRIEGITFAEACEFISTGSKMYIPEYTPPEKVEKPSIIVSTSEHVIEDSPSLVAYLTGVRKVNLDVAIEHCHYVNFTFPNSQSLKVHAGIGFRNDMGGWEIRNEIFKVSSAPKGFTTIKGTNPSSHVNVFEGFMDFLSALTYFGVTRFKNTSYVLNGVGQIGALINFLEGKSVNYYGDNDSAGDKVLIKMKLHGLDVTDCRDMYEWFNDFNQFLTSLK